MKLTNSFRELMAPVSSSGDQAPLSSFPERLPAHFLGKPVLRNSIDLSLKPREIMSGNLNIQGPRQAAIVGETSRVNQTPESFMPYDALEPGLVVRTEIKPIPGEASEANVQTNRLTLYNGRGEQVGGYKNFSVEYRYEQDVLDLLAYYERDGEFFVAVTESIRPVLATRPDHLNCGYPETGVTWNLPGGYIRMSQGLSGIEPTVSDLLDRKIGVTAAAKSEILGGAAFPSVGGSTECCFMRAVKVNPPAEDALMLIGKKLGGSRVTKFVSLQSVVDSYLAGEYHDPRLLEAVFRFAEKHSAKLRVNLPLTKNEISLPAENSRVLDPSTAKKIFGSNPSNPDAIVHIELDPDEARKSSAFLQSSRLRVRNINADGKPLDEYDIDCVTRKGLDAVDVGAYFWSEGKLYMPVKRGVRPAIAARNSAPHPIHTQASVLNLEGIAESLEGETSIEAIAQRAVCGINEEVGLAPVGNPLFVGYEYPSPGFNPERSYRFLVEVDPNTTVVREQSIGETIDVFYIEVDDLLALSDQGIVRDLRLTLNAHLLKAAFNYENPSKLAVRYPRNIVAEFEELVNSGSKLQELLFSAAPDIDRKLSRLPEYRKLKLICENDVGLVSRNFIHPDEQIFFSALIPIYAVLSSVDARRLPFHLLHDMRHYTMGDFIPFVTDSSGKLVRTTTGEYRVQDYEEYRRACLGNESEAIYYSDYVLPNLLGVEEANKCLGGTSVADVFKKVGLDPPEALAAIQSIVIDGIIPERILVHPDYLKFRPEIVEHLLRYHVLFNWHTRMVYDNWCEHPEVATTMLNFNERAFTERSAHESNFEKSWNDTLGYTEGLNPLRAAISQTINAEIRVQALRIAYFLEEMPIQHRRKYGVLCREAEEYLSELQRAYTTLQRILPMVTDTDQSSSNLRAFQILRSLRRGVIADAIQFADALGSDGRFLTQDQIEGNRGRLLPFFRPLPFATDETMADQIEERERASFERIKAA